MCRALNIEREQMNRWPGGRREPFCWGVLIRKDSMDEARLGNKCITAGGVGRERHLQDGEWHEPEAKQCHSAVSSLL